MPTNKESTLMIKPDGTKIWHIDNYVRHRIGGPAVIFPDGEERWVVNGELHREDGPAMTKACGSKYWHLNGYLHRDGGPAVIGPDGHVQWYYHGKLHCETGPAVLKPYESDEYWLLGRRYSSKEEWKVDLDFLRFCRGDYDQIVTSLDEAVDRSGTYE